MFFFKFFSKINRTFIILKVGLDKKNYLNNYFSGFDQRFVPSKVHFCLRKRPKIAHPVRLENWNYQIPSNVQEKLRKWKGTRIKNKKYSKKGLKLILRSKIASFWYKKMIKPHCIECLPPNQILAKQPLGYLQQTLYLFTFFIKLYWETIYRAIFVSTSRMQPHFWPAWN